MTNVAVTAEALLASLMAQAEGRGVDLITLRALVEESSQAGAQRALASLGLDDERARRDMDELRELLSARRDAKRSAWRAVLSRAVGLILAVLLLGMAARGGGPGAAAHAADAAHRHRGAAPAAGFDEWLGSLAMPRCSIALIVAGM